jgi:cell division protein FtsI (penicillin-binding protein 3)/stage V sporulation protein D (sporulation-specific penicillin-binding protein)
MRAEFLFRVRLLTWCVIIFALVLAGRLYSIQIIHGAEFSNRADRQYASPVGGLYDRGSIFLRDKEGKLVSGATLRSGFLIALNPSSLSDPEDAYQKLSSVLAIDEEVFSLRAGKKDDPYEEIATRVTAEEAEKIRGFGIEGVNIYRDRWRFYPGEGLAAQTIGFVGYSSRESALSGRYGLERYYDDVLSRKGGNAYVNFFAEVFSSAHAIVFDNERMGEGDIITSLEPLVQLFLEKTVSRINMEWSSKLTGGIIVDPHTGETAALALSPAFDLNAFPEVEDSSLFQNQIVEGIYEMGSIMKPLTMAAGIDSGAVSATTTYYDAGSVSFDGYTVSNFDEKGRGMVSMQEVLNQSLNTGAAFVMNKMGARVFRDYILSFGLGEETGIDLPNESAGLISNLNSPRMIEYATASFGQGIAVTPIATVRALTALANNGVLVTPHIASEIQYTSGITKKISFPDEGPVLKPETAEEITRMLVKVVDEALLGGTVKLQRYSIAAKTGTAQIAKEGERGYYDDRSLHSFFGYFPAYDPKFLIFLYTLEPKGVRYASQTLAHPFMDLVSFLINYYEIPPDR